MSQNPYKHRNIIKNNLDQDQLDHLFYMKREALRRSGMIKEPNRRPASTPRHNAHRSQASMQMVRPAPKAQNLRGGK